MVIAGPCVLENESLTLQIAEQLTAACDSLSLPLIFKASFDKANRTSLSSYRGPGLDEGLRILERVHQEHSVVVTTDIHEASQAATVAEVCELLQILSLIHI